MNSLADRIIQKEYIKYEYKKWTNSDIIDMSREININELYPCMLVGHLATKIILPKKLKILFSNTFFGLVNPFDLEIKDTKIGRICKNVFYKNSIQSVSFPDTLKRIDSNNFVECNTFESIIDLSMTKIKILEGILNNMKTTAVYLPSSLKAIKSSFNDFECSRFFMYNADIRYVDERSFRNFKIYNIFNSVRFQFKHEFKSSFQNDIILKIKSPKDSWTYFSPERWKSQAS